VEEPPRRKFKYIPVFQLQCTPFIFFIYVLRVYIRVLLDKFIEFIGF
jgi:hypothetical protein